MFISTKPRKQQLQFRLSLTAACVAAMLVLANRCAGQFEGDADFDGDGVVSGVDGLIWQRGYGNVSATSVQGDADGDRDVDSSDLHIFETQLNSGFAGGGSMGTDNTVELWLQLFETPKTFKLLARTSDIHGIAGANIEIRNANTLAFDNSVWSGATANPAFTTFVGRTLFSVQDLGGTVIAGIGSSGFIQLGTGTYLSASEQFLPRFEHCEVNLLTGARLPARIAPTPVTRVTIEPPQPLIGDYNNNNIVDAADYVLWRDTLGKTYPPFLVPADGNGNNIIDPGDYQVWRAHFGQTVGSGSGSAAESPAGVPEPNMLTLAAAGVLGLFAGARPREIVMGATR